MNCQLCNKAIETLMEWLTGECSGDLCFGHKLTSTEVEVLRLRRPPEKKEEVAP